MQQTFDNRPSQSLFQFLKDAFSQKSIPNIFREAGADFVGYYMIWTVDKVEDGKEIEKYFAINPYDQKIFALSTKDQPPVEGKPITSERLILEIYVSITKYLHTYRQLSEVVLS